VRDDAVGLVRAGGEAWPCAVSAVARWRARYLRVGLCCFAELDEQSVRGARRQGWSTSVCECVMQGAWSVGGAGAGGRKVSASPVLQGERTRDVLRQTTF
jgi:hypothetical protein